MNAETVRTNPETEIAQNLLEQLLEYLPQEQQSFFETDPAEQSRKKWRGILQDRNPDRLVIDADIIDDFRYKAAMYGAGFHPSQFEDISYEATGESGTLVYTGLLGEIYVHQLPSIRSRDNRMWDEIKEELFTSHVPSSTKYDLSTGSYITTPEDIHKIFEFDYRNLRACRELNFDLLYERED